MNSEICENQVFARCDETCRDKLHFAVCQEFAYGQCKFGLHCKNLHKACQLFEDFGWCGRSGCYYQHTTAQHEINRVLRNRRVGDYFYPRKQTSFDQASFDQASFDQASFDQASFDQASFDQTSNQTNCYEPMSIHPGKTWPGPYGVIESLIDQNPIDRDFNNNSFNNSYENSWQDSYESLDDYSYEIV